MASMAEAIKKRKKEQRTTKNTFLDFPIGTRVRVITYGQDFCFFKGNELGVVKRNSGKYLGIWVEFKDQKRMTGWNFNPDDLKKLKSPAKLKPPKATSAEAKVKTIHKKMKEIDKKMSVLRDKLLDLMKEASKLMRERLE